MADRYKNKYRIPSARWSEWDYGSNAAYFVTICTAHRERFFGEIVQGEMQLSEIGLIAQEYWLRIPSHFPFVVLDAFVIMPNHVHGIIVINKHDGGDGGDATGGGGNDVGGGNAAGGCDGRDAKFCVSTGGNANANAMGGNANAMGGNATGANPNGPQNRFGPQSRNLASIIRGYKSAVTKYAVMNGALFAWQSRFHDRVIRNRDEWQRTAEYIYNNPQNWDEDEMF